MKVAISILLALFLITSVQAQDSLSTRKKHPLLEIGVFTASVIMNGLGDGLNSRTYYNSGHLLSAASIGSLLVLPIFSKADWKYPITYLGIRYALFDAFYNIGAHRKLSYEGGKNYYDEGAGKLGTKTLDATKIASLGFVIYLDTKKKH